MLQRRHDHVNVERDPQTQQQTGQGADHSHHRALHHKNAHDAGRTGAQGTQNGNVSALVGHRHNQRADQVERGHRHDEGQNDEHHAFFNLHRGKPGAVLAGPVTNQQIAGERAAERIRNRARLVQVAQFQAHTGRAFQAENAGGVLPVGERHRRIVFKVAGIKGTQHRHLLEARHHTGRCNLPTGSDQGDFVARPHTQRTGQLRAQHHTKFAGYQFGQHSGLRACHQVGYLALQSRVNAPHQNAFHVFTPRQQCLSCYKRCSTDHLCIGFGLH